MNAQLARLTARDRVSFNQIACSEDIREGIMARLLEASITTAVPSTHTCIRDHVIRYSQQIKTLITKVFSYHVHDFTYLILLIVLLSP